MRGLRGDAPREDRPRSWAEIDVSAFASNVRTLRERAPGGRLMAVLKADAYGHGARILAPAARDAGAVALGVGDSTEALELRQAGVSTPILILGALVPNEIPSVVASGITPVVHSTGRLAELEEEARRQGRVLAVHLKVDTGMARLGMRPRKVPDAARAVARSRWLRLEGIMSHLAGSGAEGRLGNRDQARRFVRLLEDLSRARLRPPQVHLRNSAGLLDEDLRVPGETLARAGAALYGFAPAGAAPPDLHPVLSLKTQIVFLKDVESDTRVGYGGTFATGRATRLAVVPLGYDDGVPPGLSRAGEVLVRGRRARVAGAVSMDYTTIDITDVPGARVGDEVTFIGARGGDRITVEEVARAADTMPYAVVCGLGRRVVRVPAGERVTAG